MQTPLQVLLAAAITASPIARAETPFQVVEVADRVFVHTGRHEQASAANLGDIANIGYIIGERAVAVIDAGGSPEIGRRLREDIRSRTDLPIAYLILTHAHPDHVFGSSAFAPDDPAVVGHGKLESALARRMRYYRTRMERLLGYAPRPLFPTVSVDSRLEVDLGDRVLELTAHPTAHTDHDLSVFDRRTATLWLSDLLFVERVPSLDGSVNGWLRVMEQLTAVDAERVVPGHGPASLGWPRAAAAQIRYLTRLREDVRAQIQSHATISDAISRVAMEEKTRWRLFEAYHPGNVTRAFAELEWE